MDNQQFMIEVENSHNRSKRLLLKKEKEYSDGIDRLHQFYVAGKLQSISPVAALFGMATKHITSIADMVHEPDNFSLKQWNSKVTDLRNYTYLLDALLRDMEVE